MAKIYLKKVKVEHRDCHDKEDNECFYLPNHRRCPQDYNCVGGSFVYIRVDPPQNKMSEETKQALLEVYCRFLAKTLGLTYLNTGQEALRQVITDMGVELWSQNSGGSNDVL